MIQPVNESHLQRWSSWASWPGRRFLLSHSLYSQLCRKCWRCRGLKAKSPDSFNGLNTGKPTISFSRTEQGLTQDFDLHWLAAIELRHTLNLSEGHVVSTLKAVTSLIQTRDHSRIVLDGSQQDRCQKAHFTILLHQQGDRQTFVIMDIMALRGCSPLVSYTIMSSPKSQKSCLQRRMHKH